MMAEPAARRILDEAVERGWIEFEMGGGITEIWRRLEFLAAAGPNDHTRMVERARLWLMFDRDADSADRSQPSQDSERVRRLAEQIDTPWPLAANQLDRRSIENYVPPHTLRAWWCHQPRSAQAVQRRQSLVQAFLTDETRGGPSDLARRHFNMKRGLLGDLPRARRDQVERAGPPLQDSDLDPLFRALDPGVRDALAQGGGFKDVGAAFSEPGAVVDNDLHHEVDPAERRRLLGSILSRM